LLPGVCRVRALITRHSERSEESLCLFDLHAASLVSHWRNSVSPCSV